MLVNVSQILQNSFREGDVVVRMGGDEFAVLMPLSDVETVQKACQRIRDKTQAYNEINIGMPISMSVGWSVGTLRVNSNIFEIIKEADSRMYADKQINHSKYAALFKERLDKYGDKLFCSNS